MPLAPVTRENIPRQTGTAFTQPSAKPLQQPQPTQGYPPGKAQKTFKKNMH